MKRAFKRTLALGLGIAALAVTAAAAPTPKDAKPQARVGDPAPAWTLEDLDGKSHSLADFKGKTVVLEWSNPSCPFIVNAYGKNLVQETIAAMKKMGEDHVYLVVNSTANKGKDAVMTEQKEFLAKHKVEVPSLVDYDGTVGKAYGARTTPHMYVIDSKGVLRYHGAFTDDPRFNKGAERTNYVLDALAAIKAGETVSPDYVQPWGCSVKYAR